MENELAPTCTIPRARMAALLVLAALPVLLTAAAFPFLGDTVPVHYGSSGPDEWGSKTRLFVVAGILTAFGLLLAGLYAVVEHQRQTGREDWIVLDGSPKNVFPLSVVTIILMIVGQALYVGGAFSLASPPELPADLLELLLNGLFGLIVASLAGCALYMLITGKGLAGVNFQPKPSELERSLGAPKSQARAIGALLLFLAVVVIAEWAVLFW